MREPFFLKARFVVTHVRSNTWIHLYSHSTPLNIVAESNGYNILASLPWIIFANSPPVKIILHLKYVFWTQLTLMLFEPGFCSLKTEKARKKRSKKRFVHATNPDQVINLIYNLAGGTICAGLDCFQFLWLFTGQAEFDNRTDLQYCSQTCLNTRTPMLSVIVCIAIIQQP